MSYTYEQGTKNKKHHKLSIMLIGLIIASGVAVVATHVHAKHYLPVYKLAKEGAAPKPILAQGSSINYGLPVRLKIPKIQVDAHVIYEGLTKDGSMSVPSNVIDAGWYKYGALPGNTGTAVIAGHLDGLRGEPGVFSNLTKLVAGDAITVTENNGLIVTFIVRETRNYAQNEHPTAVFSGASGAHLNLITCTGSWDSSEHQFSQRLVVFADKAP